jgi:hypothetical protein
MGLNQVKAAIKSKFPQSVGIYRSLKSLYSSLRPSPLVENKDIRTTFSEIYRQNYWGDSQSFSGAGSNLVQTATLRAELPLLLREIGAKSMLDAPCGDYHWMRATDLKIEKYIGADIVPEMIARNQQAYSSETVEFMNMDITKDNLPEVDVIFCRDALVHFSYRDIFAAIVNFKASKSKYLLTTTFTERQSNRDIATGDWRTINLQLPPFGFPEPVDLINENCREANGNFSDKCMALWRLEDINV